MYGELGTAVGLKTVTCAGDLPKLYEHIDHGVLIQEAVALGYPKRLLMLNIGAYRGERRCKVGDSTTRAVYATRAIGGGCSHAHALIKVYTLRTLVRLEARFPPVAINVVVGDVLAQFFGKNAIKLAAVAREFTKVFKKKVEEDLKLVVNVKKTAVAAGDDLTARP